MINYMKTHEDNMVSLVTYEWNIHITICHYLMSAYQPTCQAVEFDLYLHDYVTVPTRRTCNC